MAPPVALITGASRGIGRAASVVFSNAGYRLALVARSLSDLEETARLARVDDILLLPGNVQDPDDCRRAIDKTVRHFGRLDAAVNVAGYAPVLLIEQTSVEEWRRVLETNLSSVFFLTKFAWPHLKRTAEETGHAAIVNISSLASRDPFPGFAAYGAAKAGLNILALSAAREGQAHRIGVYTIAPGAVETTMFRSIMSPDQFPTERTLAPADVAQTILQCATGQLRHTSGEVIYLHKTV